MASPELNELTWRRSTYSGNTGNACVEIASRPAEAAVIRDSKSPAGPALAVDLGGLLAAVKTDRINRDL